MKESLRRSEVEKRERGMGRKKKKKERESEVDKSSRRVEGGSRRRARGEPESLTGNPADTWQAAR